MNCIANILGLGWAATPAGLKAMEELKNLEEERRAAGGISGKLPAVPKGVASDEMCVFLILNISSLQLIPMNVVAYRSQYGSVNPTAIVGPAILATAVSTLAGESGGYNIFRFRGIQEETKKSFESILRETVF